MENHKTVMLNITCELRHATNRCTYIVDVGREIKEIVVANDKEAFRAMQQFSELADAVRELVESIFANGN